MKEVVKLAFIILIATTGWSSAKECKETELSCSSGSCTHESLVSDQHKDCTDGSNEGSHCSDPCDRATCSHNCRNTPAGLECYCNDGYLLDKDNKTCSDINECIQEGFCSHKCENTPGSYKCTCNSGYELVNRTCRARGVDPLLVFTTLQEIRAFNLRSERSYLVRYAVTRASAVDVDPKTGDVFWVEISEKPSIYASNMDGSGFRTILSHGLLVPEDIAVDYVAKNLYLTDSGLQQVLACKMDGTMCTVLHKENVGKPRSIVLDIAEGYIYWSDRGEKTSGIYRSGMDGSRRVPLVSSGIAWPSGIAIDHSTNRLYWVDAKLKKIEFISLNGSMRKVILNETVFHPYSLTVFEDSLFWSEWTSFSLESCSKFTGHKMTLLARENGRHIMGVHVYHPVLTAKVSNPCWSNECSHLCLLSPTSGFTCACPDDFQLGSDKKTCTKRRNRNIRSVNELSRMLEAVADRNPFDFISYGKFCGKGGDGEPVDPIDICCMRHDLCYDVAKNGSCSKFGEKSIYRMEYEWRIEQNGTITCVPGEACKMDLCLCDKIFSNCVKENLKFFDEKKIKQLTFLELLELYVDL